MDFRTLSTKKEGTVYVFSIYKPQNKEQKKSTVVTKLKARYEWCFSRLKCNKIGAADGITSLRSKNSRNNVFRRKQTTNKVPPNKFRGFEVRRKVRLKFWRQKDSMKGKCYPFSGFKQRNKAYLVYLECKLQEDSYGWCSFKLKCGKTVEITYLETSKQQTRCRWSF